MGFPTRILRQAFGPLALLSKRVALWPDKEIGPALQKLVLWQLAGLGLGGSMVWGVFTSSGANPTFVAGGSTWRPDDQSFANPGTKLRSASGSYEIGYSASYADETGASQSLGLSAAIAVPLGLTDMRGVADVRVDGRTIDVRLRNSAGALTDGKFLLVAF